MAQEQPVFRVSSTLVQVDAVVTDSKGHQVTNLTASDFEIYADGKLQTIKQFAYVSVALPKDPPAQAAHPASNIRREDVRRTIVLMIDDLNLSFESLAFVRASLLKFIDQQAEAGDLISVYRTGAGSGAVQQFTADRRVTRAIISKLRWNPNGVGRISFLETYDQYSDLRSPNQRARGQDVNQDDANPRGTNGPTVDATSLPSSRGLGQLENLRRNTMTAGALGAIDYVVQALREMPGRKSVVLFSDGFNLDRGDDRVVNAMRRLVDRANRSGTVIYTMHTAGLQVLLPTAGDNPDLSKPRSSREVGEAISTMTGNRSEELFNAQAGLDYLAKVTGGFPYLNGNDLNFGLAQVLEDQRGYYVLAYSPPTGTFDEKDGERPYHKLKVILKDKGRLTIRSRSGFFGATDDETKPVAHGDALEQLRATLFSPFSSAGIRVRLTPIYSEVVGHGSVVRNLLDVDTRDLTFKTMPDGSAQTALKLLVAAYGVDNKPIRTFAADYKFTVMPGKMKDAERDGVMYALSMEIPKPGGVQIRAAVLEEATEKTGSAQEYLEIPDVRKKQISLTSVVLANGTADGKEGMPLDASAARRQFQRGSVLQYFCLVESGHGRNERDLMAQLRIVRGDKQMLLLPVKVTRLADNKRAISGQLKLGSALVPGDYFLQVIASVRGAGKAAITEQWNDFEIVP